MATRPPLRPSSRFLAQRVEEVRMPRCLSSLPSLIKTPYPPCLPYSLSFPAPLSFSAPLAQREHGVSLSHSGAQFPSTC
jgi:hypothetical protein